MPKAVGDALKFKSIFYDLDGIIRTDVTVAVSVRKPGGTAISPAPTVSQVGNWYEADVSGVQNDEAGEWVATFSVTDDGDVSPLNEVITEDVDASVSTGITVDDLFTADPTDYDTDPDSFAARFLNLPDEIAAELSGNELTVISSVEETEAGVLITTHSGHAGRIVLSSTDTRDLDADGAEVSVDVGGTITLDISVSGTVGDWTLTIDYTEDESSQIPIGKLDYEINLVQDGVPQDPPIARVEFGWICKFDVQGA